MQIHHDPDLPGDAAFVPVAPGLHPDGRVAYDVQYQAAIWHNQMRYAELQKLRAGQPNLYLETRYR